MHFLYDLVLVLEINVNVWIKHILLGSFLIYVSALNML